ncbi:CHAP domain-containing protein [Azospirillum sp. TSH100]|uniref:CHAP domain-containing protein n=1 Tax=Azospirillum sp. TSH100 TaxID=652764 RepID=UPI0010AB21ED|nr:CHAP domain-containing protein [Azospirillum sp. TSH100]QCG90267.1 hypothetical protein E6C72_21265 [Azospirillum sp. TSH100]
MRPEILNKPEEATAMGEVLDTVDFVETVQAAADTVNVAFGIDPHGVSAEYLLILAWLESGWRNVQTEVTGPDGRPATSATGPFQFTAETWRDLLNDQSYAGILEGMTEDDRTKVDEQCIAAACQTHKIQTALYATTGKAPSGVELRIGHLLGVAGVGRFLQLALDDLIDKSLGGKPAVSAKAIANNRRLLAEDDRPATRRTVETRVAAEMRAAAAAVADRIGKVTAITQNAVAQVAPPQDGSPPWLVVAERELARGVVERPGIPTDPAVTEYFKSIGIDAGDEEAWCASFVSYCLIKSGAESLKTLRQATHNVPERAENWRLWGKALAAPQLGAIVVLKPTEDASGHVGFYVGPADAEHFLLLGGNQSPKRGEPQQVCIASISKSRLRDDGPFRWPLD